MGICKMSDQRTSETCVHGALLSERACDWGCHRSSNERFCPQTVSEADYLELQRMDIATEGSLGDILNRNGHASWTGCPRCHVDDFTHVDGCSLLPTGASDVATVKHEGT